MKINMCYSGVKVDVEFGGKLNILSGYSGTGKTFLMQAVELFCLNHNISCIFGDYGYKNIGEEKIKGLCIDVDVVILDNADLYVTNDLLMWLREQNKMAIICMKDTSRIDMSGVCEYIVNYNNGEITIEEF